ncbi:MAG: SIMPL domain-containing protein [Clostridia bacterium]|nr:SIMPL domain-containing protein [Clostridia bacterium]
MDIIVSGSASQKFKPDEVTINLTFLVHEKTYEKALEEGAKCVDEFIKMALEKLEMSKECFKTSRFYVSEVNRYNPTTQKRVFDGYSFNQYSYIKFDYDVKIVTKFMDLVSSLKNPPNYVLNFNIKDMDRCKNIVLAEAYNKAKEKAEVIALASGKKLIDCLKVDFKPFTEHLISDTSFRNTDFGLGTNMEKTSIGKAKQSLADTLERNFTPEDVCVKETIYCLWTAE